MTWKQFKEEVESQGVTDATELTHVEVDRDYHPVALILPETRNLKRSARILSGNRVRFYEPGMHNKMEGR